MPAQTRRSSARVLPSRAIPIILALVALIALFTARAVPETCASVASRPYSKIREPRAVVLGPGVVSPFPLRVALERISGRVTGSAGAVCYGLHGVVEAARAVGVFVAAGDLEMVDRGDFGSAVLVVRRPEHAVYFEGLIAGEVPSFGESAPHQRIRAEFASHHAGVYSRMRAWAAGMRVLVVRVEDLEDDAAHGGRLGAWRRVVAFLDGREAGAERLECALDASRTVREEPVLAWVPRELPVDAASVNMSRFDEDAFGIMQRRLTSESCLFGYASGKARGDCKGLSNDEEQWLFA